MYDFYSTNFAYQTPPYPNAYAYSSSEMNASCNYRFPNYGFQTGHGGPSYQPCERVPNLASRAEGIRMAADNTPSNHDLCTRTLQHFPPISPPNMNTINSYGDEPLKKTPCSMDKLLEELSDEGTA